ncbi:MAG: hypothetical protein ACLRWF_00080 [Ruthenibacterium sp.]
MLAGWARALLELDEAALVRIAFRDEPLRGKLTEAMKQSLYEGARAEGEARAALLQEDGGALSLDEAAARWRTGAGPWLRCGGAGAVCRFSRAGHH